MKKKLNRQWNTLSKCFFLIYIVYQQIISPVFYKISSLSITLMFAALLLELLSDEFVLKYSKSVIAFAAFAVYLLTTTLLIAENQQVALHAVKTFTEYTLVVYLILRYSVKDGKVDFVLLIFILQATAAAIITLVNGDKAEEDIMRVGISENVNVNGTAVAISFAIGFVLFLIIREKHSPLSTVIGIVLILLYLAAIMQTGSKKGILSALALIAFWLIFSYRGTFAKLPPFVRVLLFAALIAVGYFAYQWYTKNNASQMVYVESRFGELGTGRSDTYRLYLMKEGFGIFLDHPLLGVGIDNSREFLGTYTHCFYSELMACTGLVGTILFGYGLFQPAVSLLKWIFEQRKCMNEMERTRIRFAFSMFGILMIIAFTQIIFYEFSLMYVTAFLVAFTEVSVQKKDDTTLTNHLAAGPKALSGA